MKGMEVEMRKISLILIASLLLASVAGLSGCATYDFAEEGTVIISPSEALELVKEENVVLIDARNEAEYEAYHVEGAVNIPRSAIVTDKPYPNMLAPKVRIESVMGNSGISNDTLVVVYDNNKNMDAARLWWTLLVYGHENAKIINGGVNALAKDGVEFVQEVPEVEKAQFEAEELNTDYIATKEEIEGYLNEPQEDILLLDTRTQEEYSAGTIPGSVLYNFENNNYSTGAFKSPKDIQNDYIDIGITPEQTIVMFCKTSIRGAQTFAALYNAGYRNLKLYDGAWVEWSGSDEVPEEEPADTPAPPPSSSDGS
jgi:thiosulfate/3-mercaptopyruvate sulfurtransferase